jgi:general secretion pathway protein A
MYEQFYGLNAPPFALLPDPSFMYLSKDHGMALTLLRYSILNKQGFTVITGEIGSGKTTLINRIIDELDENITVGLINFTHTAFGELSEWVLMAFGLDYRNKSKVEIYDTFVKFLIDQFGLGKRVVLIIDEAQNMEPRTLEEVRMLTNVNAQNEYLLHLIILGQPELRATLERSELRQLTQRVSVFYHIGALTLKDTEHYVAHRLRVAGGDPEIFSRAAIETIWEQARGIPRVINTLCDLSLVYGYSANQKTIDKPLVLEVVHDRNEMGLVSAESANGSGAMGSINNPN